MPEQELDGAQVRAGLKQMYHEEMAKQVRRDGLAEARAPAGDAVRHRRAAAAAGGVPGTAGSLRSER